MASLIIVFPPRGRQATEPDKLFTHRLNFTLMSLITDLPVKLIIVVHFVSKSVRENQDTYLQCRFS